MSAGPEAFEKAMDEYEQHFDQAYPYTFGIGYPGKTDEENISIIRKCISENKPVDLEPEYNPNYDY